MIVLGAAGRAAMRVLIWIALWASALRTLAAVAGVWSRGSWSLVATLFVGVVAPAWMFLLSPTWVGWRVVYRVELPPRSLSRMHHSRMDQRRPRAAGLATRLAMRGKEIFLLAACWLSPLCQARDLAGIRIFARVRAGRPFPEARQVPADPWTILAIALQADRQGNRALVDQIVDALLCLPPGARFPLLARVHGGEALVLSAIRRRDWPAALRYAAIGRGRLIRLLTSIAEGQLGDRSPRRRLWLRWALAPGRLRTWPLAREVAIHLGAPARVTPPPPDGAVSDDDRFGGIAVDPRAAHVRLLGEVAGGRPVALRDVLDLARAWSRDIDGAALARLGARALELDVRDPEAATRAIRERVLGELAELTAHAEGALPAPDTLGDPLVVELVHRTRERLARDVDRALGPLDAGGGDVLRPLEAWTRWLALRAVLEDVERRAGRITLTMLWHGAVRNTVWRWASTLFNQHPTETAWIAHMIFAWVADHAELVGDLPAELTNRENARVALGAESRHPW